MAQIEMVFRLITAAFLAHSYTNSSATLFIKMEPFFFQLRLITKSNRIKLVRNCASISGYSFY